MQWGTGVLRTRGRRMDQGKTRMVGEGLYSRGVQQEFHLSNDVTYHRSCSYTSQVRPPSGYWKQVAGARSSG